MFAKHLKKVCGIAAAGLALCLIPSAETFAGGINSNEARVIGVATGGFAYNNELYTARQVYVDQLIGYLSREDINLTSEQADKAISSIYANIETGVNQGYIVKQGDPRDDMDRDQKVEISEISPEEKERGIKDISEITKATPAPGGVVYEKDGKANAYDGTGTQVMSLDGVMKNTGLSLSPLVKGLKLVIAAFFATALAAACYIVCERRSKHGA